jgi:acetyl esterase/lipase
MKVLILFSLAAIFLPSTYGQRVYSDNPPRGTSFAYKEVDGVVRDIEVYFPKEKSEKPVAGIILFHGGEWRKQGHV